MPPRKPQPAEADSAIAAPAPGPPQRWLITLDRGVMAFEGKWELHDGALGIVPIDGPGFILSPIAWRRIDEQT